MKVPRACFRALRCHQGNRSIIAPQNNPRRLATIIAQVHMETVCDMIYLYTILSRRVRTQKCTKNNVFSMLSRISD